MGCCSALSSLGALARQNNRIFEGCEVTSLELKSRFLRTLFEWMSTFTNLGLSSFEEFLDLCTLS